MMVTVLIPASRFRLEYELGRGRPFGELDLLVIRAIGDGVDRIDQLTDFFQLPARLLLEMMVNLFHEGWLTFTLSGSLRLTEIGEKGCRKEIEPSSHRIIPRHMGLVMERATGGIVNSQELITQTEAKLNNQRKIWARSVRLPVQFHEDFVDPGQIKGLLVRNSSEWIRNIQPPRQESKGWHWVETRVDLDKREVVGLPESWKNRLKNEILAAAAAAPASCWLSPEDLRAFGAPPGVRRKLTQASEPGYDVSLDPQTDLHIGAGANRAKLLQVLATATSSVLAVSPQLNPDKELLDAIESAARRGVVIDLLWSRSPREPGIIQYPALHEVQTLAARLTTELSRPALRVGDRALPLGPCLLVWDQKETWHGLLGSHSWFDQSGSGQQTVSIAITHPAMIGEACLSITATMVAHRIHTLTGGAYRWRQLGTELDRKLLPPSTSTNCRVRLVHNQDLDPLLLDLAATAQTHLALAANIADPLRLVARFALRSIPLSREPIWISPTQPPPLAGIRARMIPHASVAGVVLADTSALLTTRNWFDSQPEAGGVREMGLLIDGGPIPGMLWKWIANQWSTK